MRGEGKGASAQSMLETISNPHFERFGGRRIEVSNDVRVTSSQDNTRSKVQQYTGSKVQGHDRYRISGIHKFFLANKGGASIRILLWESLLVPDMLTLMPPTQDRRRHRSRIDPFSTA